MFVIISTFGQLLAPSMVSTMISDGVNNSDYGLIYGLAITIAVIAVLAFFSSMISNFIASKITTKFCAELRREFFHKVQTFSSAEVDKFGTSSLITRSTTDVTTIQNFLSQFFKLGIMGTGFTVIAPTLLGYITTTLINLLMRFYEINDGKIIVDGVDSKEMTRHELRTHFGMVLQDTWLFEGTIRDNLKYGTDREVSDEEMIEAAKSVCADNFIRTMPGGYDMMLSKGAENISKGQRQLLTIARAIIANPEIMILYMENGDIKEVGNHETLMAKGGKYADLYNSQFA